ncbi:hypothetical protein ABZS66_05420, partial [Dactylosporangium sp. NPDC005572]|uniref:hypothetical protein n=1 Tax=Dactylosporangium sp. NPDC005572 TaxID=3156889 RepID=UPI0033BC95A1
MLYTLIIPMVLAPAPIIAIAVLAVRLRAGRFATRLRASLRDGSRRPIRQGLVAVAVGTAAVTFALERLYLAMVTSGPRWEFDVVLLALTLGLLVSVGCAVLAGLAAAAVARVRGFGAGTV